MTTTTLNSIAIADIFTTTEDLSLTGNVLLDNGNGADLSGDGSPLIVQAVNGDGSAVGTRIQLASGALLTLNSDGTFFYDSSSRFDYLTPQQVGTDSFTYTVVDGTNTPSTTTVTVKVNGVNDAPIINDTTIFVQENKNFGAYVGSFFPIHADYEDSVFLRVTGGDGGFGVENVRDGRGFVRYGDVYLFTSLDYESRSTYQFTVQGSDFYGAVDTATITIQVVDVNEAPVLNDYRFRINENAAIDSRVGRVRATDPDARQRLTYEIIGGNERGIFQINQNTGNVTIADNQQLNYESITQQQLLIKVTDNGEGNLSDTGLVTIDILDVNEAPLIGNYLFSVAENSPADTVVGQVIATDEDPEQEITYNILQGNEQGIFAVDTITGVISVASGVSLDYETQSQYILEVSATDNGNYALSSLSKVTINVSDVLEDYSVVLGVVDGSDTLESNILEPSFLAADLLVTSSLERPT